MTGVLTEPPAWLRELLEIFTLRRTALVAASAAVAALGLFVTWFAPGLLPSTALVGAAVGVAAVLVAMAAAIAVDAGDLVVRGPRHVRAAGARVAAVVSTQPSVDGASGLAQAVRRHVERSGPQRLALAAPAAGGATSQGWAEALATALSLTGTRVLLVDLTHGSSDDDPGLLDVARGQARLGQVVSFDPDLMLARVGPGGALDAALLQLPQVLDRLPADIEVVLVATPNLQAGNALGAVAAVGSALLLVQIDHTSRVELLAGLDSLDANSTRAEVLLLSEQPTPPPAPPTPDAATLPPAPDDAPAPEAAPSATDDTPRPVPVDAGDTAPLPPLVDLDRTATSAPVDRLLGGAADAGAGRVATLVGAREAAAESDPRLTGVAAVQTLAQEIWARDGRAAGEEPDAG